MNKLLIPVLLLLAGCAPSIEPDATIKKYSFHRGSYVREFRLSDGTRCVTRDDSIACEWKNQCNRGDVE